jgi:hypothetical protein
MLLYYVNHYTTLLKQLWTQKWEDILRDYVNTNQLRMSTITLPQNSFAPPTKIGNLSLSSPLSIKPVPFPKLGTTSRKNNQDDLHTAEQYCEPVMLCKEERNERSESGGRRACFELLNDF